MFKLILILVIVFNFNLTNGELPFFFNFRISFDASFLLLFCESENSFQLAFILH